MVYIITPAIFSCFLAFSAIPIPCLNFLSFYIYPSESYIALVITTQQYHALPMLFTQYTHMSELVSNKQA